MSAVDKPSFSPLIEILKMKSAIISIISALFTIACFSQILIDNNQTAEYYIKNVLVGSGIEVGQIKYVGMIGGLGQFNSDTNVVGMNAGLVLSTGNVDSIIGPNDSKNYTSRGELPESKQLQSKIKQGDRDLNRLCRGKTKDITVIEFDFVPINNSLEFNYFFASEEYPEFVGSAFNDVFGFFLSGPGIKNKINLAVLQDGKTPITINNVNQKKNKFFFQRNVKPNRLKKIFLSKEKTNLMNDLSNKLQFDGLTTLLTAHFDVIPYKKYHIKIAIGDVSDRAYDSGVFLEAGSFTSRIDSTGTYFENLQKIVNSVKPNIDSLFKNDPPFEIDSNSQIDSNFEITDIYFDYDSYIIVDSFKLQLDSLAKYLLLNDQLKCTLYGYTDNNGSKNYNQKLSERRAESVMNYLITKGVGKDKLKYSGYNFENPISDNDTVEGRSKNRRVEIIVENE
jgi:outer membrane protein OmpA-like peptidoglycan-associated protein